MDQARDFRPTPEFQALTRSILGTREAIASQAHVALSRGIPSCNQDNDCLTNMLPQALDVSLNQARSNPGVYRVHFYFLAAQFSGTEDAAARSGIQNHAREIARTALDRICDPNFTPQGDTPGELPARVRARLIFNIVSTLSAVLAQDGSETYTPEDRALMREYFVRIRGFLQEVHAQHRQDSNIPDTPEYFDHYVDAQLALSDGHVATAFSEFLQTRQLLSALPEQVQNAPMPTQLRVTTEMALQSIPRRGTGAQVEGLRNLLTIEALGFIHQNQHVRQNGESSATEAQRQSQALSLVSASYLQAGHTATDATALLHHLASESNSPDLRQILEGRLSSDAELRRGISSVFPGNLNDATELRQVVSTIVEFARHTASSVLDNANNQPYRTVFAHDGYERPIAHAIHELGSRSALLATLRSSFGLDSAAPAETVVRELISYGENLPALLANLPENLRSSHENLAFFQDLRQAAQGYDGDGMRLNVENPLLDTIDSLHQMAESDDANAAAYYAIFETIHNLEQVGPDASLPTSLRRSAGNYSASLQNFSGSRVIRHLFSPSSVGMMLAGIALSELAPIWLLRGAGASGELGTLVRGGQLTFRGHLVTGLGVGLAMQAGSVGAHLLSTHGLHGSEYGRELQSIGYANLARGTLFSMLAMAGTIGVGSWAQRRILPEGATFSTGQLAMRHVGLRLTNWGVGGSLMLGAHSANAAFGGHSARPTGEQAAEVFLSMALWDAGAFGVRMALPRLFSRYGAIQAGPFRVEQMVQARSARIVEANPSLRESREAINQYLRAQSRDWQNFNRIEAELNRGLIPTFRNNESGGELTFAPARARGSRRAAPAAPANPPASPQPSVTAQPTASADTATQPSGPVRPPPLPSVRPATEPNAASPASTSLSPEDGVLVLAMARSSALQDRSSPCSIHAIREAVRHRMQADEVSPVVWGRVVRSNRHIDFEPLAEAPAADQREGTFQMGMDGKVFDLQTADPVLQRLLIDFYNGNDSLSSRILRTSEPPAAEPVDRESATAAHRIPAGSEDITPIPGANPVARSSSPAAPESNTNSDAPEAPAVTESPVAPAAGGDPEDLPTGPHTRTRRTTGERRDATIQYTTAVEAERRAASARGDETGVRPTSTPRSEEPEEVMNIDDEVELLADPDSDLTDVPEVLRPPPPAEPNGGALEADPATGPIPPPLHPRSATTDPNSRVTMPPPATYPSEPDAQLLAGSTALNRGTRSTMSFQQILRRINEASPVSQEEVTMQVATSFPRIRGYASFAEQSKNFVLRLIPRNLGTARDIDIFHVRIDADDSMWVVNPEQYRENPDLSYFQLRRVLLDPNDISRVDFHLNETSLMERHVEGGWDEWLMRAFPPLEPNRMDSTGE